MEPSHLEGYEVCACDWAGRKSVYWTIDGVVVNHSTNLMEMLDTLVELVELNLGLRIVLEPMFESFGTKDARDVFVRRCGDLGIVLQRVSSRMTHWFRHNRHVEIGHTGNVDDCKEDGCKKTDELDCLRIWDLAHIVHCSAVFLNSDPEQQAFAVRSSALNEEAMILRKTGLKEELMSSISEALPIDELPEGLEESLVTGTGKNRKYRAGVPSIWLAVRESRNRDEFERFLGLHGNGNSCQLRSDMYYWMWKFIRNKVVASGGDVKAARSKFRKDVRVFRQLLLMSPPKIRGLEDLI